MAAKKIPKKPTAAKKSSPTKRLPAIRSKYTKNTILQEIAKNTELTKKQVRSVLDELSNLIERHVKKGSVGEFILPGLFKIKTVKRAARKARKGVPSPFRAGELMDISARPAQKRVKMTALKKLKDFV